MTYIQLIQHPCSVANKNVRGVVKEQSSEYQWNNPNSKEIRTTQVDGCYYTEHTACDYLITIPKEKKALFIELKGSDVFHAIAQIQKTQDDLKTHLPEFSYHARIVPTKVSVPKLFTSPPVIRLKKICMQSGGNFLVKCGCMEETL